MKGRPARRLVELAGWEPERDAADPWLHVLRHRFFIVNVLTHYPGPSAGKGTVWPLAEAQAAAKGLGLDQRYGGLGTFPAAVLLGKRVAASLGIRKAEWCVWRPEDDALAMPHVVIPHPSGVNRVLNKRRMRAATGRALRQAVGEEAR